LKAFKIARGVPLALVPLAGLLISPSDLLASEFAMKEEPEGRAHHKLV